MTTIYKFNILSNVIINYYHRLYFWVLGDLIVELILRIMVVILLFLSLFAVLSSFYPLCSGPPLSYTAFLF